MKKALSLMLAVLLTLPLFTSCTTAKEQSAIIPAEGETVLYVSTSGDDTADGTFDAPLATLDGAKAKVRTILPTAPGAVSVYFRGGDYHMTAGVIFDEADSGKDGAPVKYAAYPDEQVRFIGGVKVDPSLITAADPASSVTARVTDETAKAALLQADVSSLIETYTDLYCIRDLRSDAFKQVELYLGENAIVPSRWPNRGGDYDFNYKLTLSDRETVVGENGERTVFFDDEVAAHAAGWSAESIDGMYLHGYPQYDWIADNLAVSALDAADHSVTVTSGTHHFFGGTGGNGRILFMNLPEEIDVPGESYVDRTAKIAYFYPTEDFDADNVWLSTLSDDMLTFDGASHFVFSGIDFLYTRGNAITFRDGEDFTMEDCTVAHTSAKAASFIRANRIHLNRCELYDTANGAVLMIGGDRENLISSENVIENCDIHDYNRSGLTYSPEVEELITLYSATAYTPGIYAAAVGMKISHNKIHGAVHQAISAEANDLVVEYNEIYDCMREAGDMGTIYYGRNPSLLGIVYRYNYFHDNGNVYPGSGQFDIYIDDGSMGPEIYGNLFTTTSAACVMMHGAQFAKITGNIFVSTSNAVRYAHWASNGSLQGDWVLFLYNKGKRSCDALQKMQAVKFDSGIWHEHYAGTIWENLYRFIDDAKIEEFSTLSDNDLERKCKGLAPYLTNEVAGNLYIDVEEIYYGDKVNEHDNFTSDDLTLFTDAEGGDYSLTDAALAEIRETCPDFEPLPLDLIGPQ